MKRSISSHLLKLAIPVFVALLVLGTMGAALASSQTQAAQGKQGLFGTVTAKSGSTLTVTTKQGTTVDLAVTQNTQFRVPGLDQPTFQDVAVGSRVAILAQGEAGSQSALRVMVIPGEPQREHRVLTVVEVSGNKVIAEDAQGTRIEVELDHSVSEDIKGQLITFIGAKSAQSDRFKANVEVKIEQVVKRLENQAKELEVKVKAESDTRVKAEKERDLARLRARLEANMQHHLDLFAEVIAKAPEQAKPSLRAALEMTLQGYKAALEALGTSSVQVKERLELRSLHGTVGVVDDTSHQIAVQTRAGAEVNVTITNDTAIRIGDKPGSFADISVGTQVNVRYNETTSVATEVHVETKAKAEGTIQTVDSAKGELTLTLANGATLTLTLDNGTRIEVNDKAATVADLRTNAVVQVEYNTQTSVAQQVEAETRAEVRGSITAVDGALGTITVTTKSGQQVVLKISDTTRVKVRGLLFGLLGLRAGMTVEAAYDVATGDALEVRVEAKEAAKARARATGTIGGVNASSGEVTVNLDGGGSITLHADGNAMVTVDRRPATLADLKAGARVSVNYDTDAKVAFEIEARSEVQKQDRPISGGPGPKSNAGPGRFSGTVVVDLVEGEHIELKGECGSFVLLPKDPQVAAELKLHVGQRVVIEAAPHEGPTIYMRPTLEVQGVTAAGADKVLCGPSPMSPASPGPKSQGSADPSGASSGAANAGLGLHVAGQIVVKDETGA
ncbi:MAG: hypothetical protein HY683_00815 [Chloroflexi bacterium]|nr:hypothetical protein [Chloroflexota bacterium]